MIEVTWIADEPREYRARGNGWTMDVTSKRPSGWYWRLSITSPEILATGSELNSHEAKEKAAAILRQILQAFPQEEAAEGR
jgi:hypothetical protein